MSIILDHINYCYSADSAYKVQALKDVSLEINAGEFIGIIGHTGSGKSTLIQHMNGLLKATSGHIYYNGQDIYDNDYDLSKLRHKVGMVFQQFNLFNNLTILENVTISLKKVKKVPAPAAEEKARALLRRVGLEDKADAYPAQLSGGQKQRIAIARVFLKNPPILILDEATSALDNESEILVGQSLEKLAHGRTTLTIAHRLTTIKDYDRILVLGEEGIVEEGTHAQLLEKQGVYYRLWNQLPAEDGE